MYGKVWNNQHGKEAITTNKYTNYFPGLYILMGKLKNNIRVIIV